MSTADHFNVGRRLCTCGMDGSDAVRTGPMGTNSGERPVLRQVSGEEHSRTSECCGVLGDVRMTSLRVRRSADAAAAPGLLFGGFAPAPGERGVRCGDSCFLGRRFAPACGESTSLARYPHWRRRPAQTAGKGACRRKWRHCICCSRPTERNTGSVPRRQRRGNGRMPRR